MDAKEAWSILSLIYYRESRHVWNQGYRRAETSENYRPMARLRDGACSAECLLPTRTA
jgi:hypothetical protein